MSEPSTTPDAVPGVSVVVPVLNEERHLAAAVARLLEQRYDGPLEVVLALGPSTDRTDEIAESLAAADPRVLLVANPTGRTPAGLNAAIGAASYDVIVRVDGHALVPDDYVAVGVETLLRTGADNVGGIMAAEGETPFEHAVAVAMTSKLGVGSASFHVGGEEGPAPTVYLGVFRRSALERVGGYDESMVRAQDWEMNHRIIESGGLVWFTPGMRVTYRPRPTVKALAKQYFEYGRWRREVARTHPDTLSARYLAAPVAVAGIATGTALGLVGIVGPSWLKVGWAAPLGYAALVGIGGLAIGRDVEWAARVRVPVVLATMHLSWGTGFLTSPGDLRD
ncbi:MAG TPA: glycosyltransferase family 2 protein [Candidatus Nanopelagicales bacterium]|nr:glycosyltransferase family 2 protein [Candidatus Nanopelagicales bacterium]